MTSVSTDRRSGVNAGRAIKAPCIIGSTADLTLSGVQDIDGVTGVENYRVLVKDQDDGTENGIYVMSSGTWSRAPDWNDPYDITQGTLVEVTQGTTNANTIWRLVTSGTITPGTTDISFASFAVSDSSNVDYTYSAASAVARNVRSRLRDRASVLDWGATGNGTNDDTTALQAAADEGVEVDVPVGTYMTTAKISLSQNTAFRGPVQVTTAASARIIGAHAGAVFEVEEILSLNGGLENLSIEKDAANINTGIGLHITGGDANVCGFGRCVGCHFIKVQTGIKSASAIFWQWEDILMNAVTNGLWLYDNLATFPNNNFNYAKNLYVTASVGAGIGLLYEGDAEGNYFNMVNLSGCTQAIKYDLSSGFTNIIEGLWLESNTSHLLLEAGDNFVLKNVTNASTVDLIDSGSTAPEVLRLRGYQSLQGQGNYTIGRGASELIDVIQAQEDYVKNVESYKPVKMRDYLSHQVTNTKNLVSLSQAGTHLSSGSPKINRNSVAMTSWGGGGGSIAGAAADPWGGTSAFTLNGDVFGVFAMGAAVASMHIVACGLVKGSGVEFTVKITGNETNLIDDTFYLTDSDWYLFVTERDIPATDTGSTATWTIDSDDDLIVCRPSLYVGTGCIVPTEYGSDLSDMSSITMLGPNLRCVGPVADPTTGRWIVGDQVIHDTPISTGTIGRVCTTAGTIGAGAVFKTFGTIA